MADLSTRSTEPEWMDQPGTSAADHAQALADLARVNRLTLTHRPILRWLQKATADLAPGSRLAVLDVASGQGDLLRLIHRWGTKRGLVLDLRGLDLNPGSALHAQAATPEGMTISWITGDVFTHVPAPPADFIVSSQFAHHLTNDQVVAFLRWLDRHAKRGWFIADLQRSRLAWTCFPLLARLMRWHRLVRIDGTISIARSFRKADWQALLADSGISATISHHIPFRLCVSALR